MHIFNFFNRSHKEPPFRNPYIYLKEQELLKLQKQKEYEELKIMKERQDSNELKDKKIALALDNLSNIASYKRLSDTRKKLIRKLELSEINLPMESLKRGSKKANECMNRPWNDNRIALKFLTLRLSKTSESSHVSSACTKNSSGSDLTVNSILCHGLRSKNQSTYNTDNTNISMFNSIAKIESKESMIPPFRSVANTELHSINYLATEYCPSGNHIKNYEQTSSTMISFQDLNQSWSLSLIPNEDYPGDNSNTSNNFDISPLPMAISVTETTLANRKRCDNTGNSSSGRKHNIFLPSLKITMFCHQGGSIVMPKANCTDKELIHFRKRYHNSYKMYSSKLNLFN